MTIMTIDPGKRKTGIFIFGNGFKRPYLIDNRKAETEKEIYRNTADKLEKLIDIFQVQIVVIEDYAYSRPGSRQLYGAEIKGIIKNITYKFDRDIKIIIMPIALWKRYVPKDIIAIRNRKKRWISDYKKAVKEYTGFDFKTEDMADAYWMAVAVKGIMRGIVYSVAGGKIRSQLL
jgi:Holliday junction resolvasome RuvABC endonuclease subunit